jgi:ketosteroid isomerase-like protein
MPAAEGKSAVVERWAGILQLPELSLNLDPVRIEVQRQFGDLAYEVGDYQLAFESGQGPFQEEGEYVVVWEKIHGAWKVAVDSVHADVSQTEA